MPNTTTIETIRDQMITKIEAITPANLANYLFRRATKRYDIRDQNPGSALFRKFEIVRTGSAEDPPFFDPSAIEREEEMTVTVAYPVLAGLYGNNDLDDMEDVIRKDAQQIRDTLFSSTNYVTGQLAAFVTIEPVNRGGPVWFQEFTVIAKYYETQSL